MTDGAGLKSTMQMQCLSFFITIQAISTSALALSMTLSPSSGRTIAMRNDRQPPSASCASSLAYGYGKGSKEKHSKLDLWRKQMSLPQNPTFTTTALSSSSPSTSMQEEGVKPIYTFGVIADIQYAPIPNGHSYGGNPRYYRHAKTAAEYAAKHFQEEQVQCVVNLGDIVDGKCSDVEKYGGSLSNPREGGENADEEKKMNRRSVAHDAVDDVLEALSFYTGRILHTYGNHELYSLSRRDLMQKLSIPFKLEPTNDLVGYYDHTLEQPHQPSSMKLRFVIIDSYDICLLGRCGESSPKLRAAHKIMSQNNPNYPEQENSPNGLEGLSKRFVGFNGGIDTPQLEWLEQSLQMARENDEKVVICSHQPIHPDSTWPTCLIWNYDEILSVVRDFNDVVIASFSGHAHKGGYTRDEISGIHFRTFEAMLESPEDIHTYACVDVWEDRLEVRGLGDCMSDIYDLDHLTM